jgi:hypothetical protein
VAGQKRCSFTAIGIRIGNWVGDELVSMVTDKMQGGMGSIHGQDQMALPFRSRLSILKQYGLA